MADPVEFNLIRILNYTFWYEKWMTLEVELA